MRDLDEKSAEVELYHHAQPYSNQLDSESRSREKPSFRIIERSLMTEVKVIDLLMCLSGKLYSDCYKVLYGSSITFLIDFEFRSLCS